MANFHTGASIQYYSTSHGCWIDAVVEEENDGGDVQISCKKGYWMGPAEQLQRLRAAPPSAGWGEKAAAPAKAPPPAKAAAGAGAARDPAAEGGYPKAAKAAQAARGGEVAEWTTDQAIGLGAHGADDMGAWAKPLDRSAVSSVHVAVEKLNQGDLPCAEDFCVVYSASSQGHYLLYRRGSRDKALAKLMDHLREATSLSASRREELAKLRKSSQAMEEQLRQARAPVATLQGDAASRLAAANEEVRRLHATLAEETARSADLNLASQSLREELLKAQEKLAEVERDAARLAADLEEERQQRRSLQGEHDALLQAYSNKEQEVQTSDSLNGWLQAAEEELSLQSALEDERAKKQKLEARISELEEQLRKEVRARERGEEELAKLRSELGAKQDLEDMGRQLPCTAPSLAACRRQATGDSLDEAKATDARQERRDREEKAEKEERREREEKAEKEDRGEKEEKEAGAERKPEKEEKEEKEGKEEGLPREVAELGARKAEACESKAEGAAEARREKAGPEEKLQEGCPDRAAEEDRGDSSLPSAAVAGPEEVARGEEEEEAAPQEKAKPTQLAPKLEAERREAWEEAPSGSGRQASAAKAEREEKLPEGGAPDPPAPPQFQTIVPPSAGTLPAGGTSTGRPSAE